MRIPRSMCDERGFVYDFPRPMTVLIRQVANQFNVSFNVVGDVPLPTPIKSETGKRLLAP
jgi:hypothetical protein